MTSMWIKIAFRVGLTLIASGALAETSPISREPGTEFVNPQTRQEVFKRLQGCLAKGEEAVLKRLGPQCAEYMKGSELLEKDTPVHLENIARLCHDGNDLRLLSADSIKRLASPDKTLVLADSNETPVTADGNKTSEPSSDAKPQPIERRGIRILGAIFCNKLDLVGLNLEYSLVLDHSIFREGIDARNFQTRADFSVDDSLIFGELGMLRSRIGGGFFATQTFMTGLRILDLEN